MSRGRDGSVRALQEDSDDEEVVATQLATQAATQQVLEANDAVTAEKKSSEEVVRCMICSKNLTHVAILERELHLNACLDAASMETKYECPTCGKELTDYNEQRRMAHVNLCLDRLTRMIPASSPRAANDGDACDEKTEEALEMATASETSEDLYTCRICGLSLPLRNLEARSRHVKQCGQRFGFRAGDLAGLTADSESNATQPSEEATSEKTTIEAPTTNAFAVMMQSAASSSTSSSSTAGGATRTTSFISNAFDVLMKSSKTQAVIKATTAVATTATNSFWRSSSSNNGKKRQRVNGSTGGSSSSSYSSSRRHGCPDFKRILGTQPPFIVDGFRYANRTLSSVYFLTHFHSDHYTGLERSFNCGVIYCNHVTAALVVQELGIDAKFVHPLPMHTPVDLHGVQVTLMDANHCPGATIILFRLRNGKTYLHTGDFRFHPKMWNYAPLQQFVPPIPSNEASSELSTVSAIPAPNVTRMDGVYLDTTYADPKYTFPTQEASIEHTLSLVTKHMNAGGDKVLFLFGSYSIGKERLFMEAARKWQRKVCVSKAKYKMISTFGWPEAEMKLITMEPSVTNLHVVPMHDLKLDHLNALLQKHRLRFHQVVGFRPTGWTFSRSHSSLSTCQSDPSGKVRIYGIPYSEHSSFAELCEFLRVLNPQVIIPTVNCHSEKQVKKQLDLLRQTAFHSISSLFSTASEAT
ncbi:hypothetical protein Poli38472_000414 [Pythium oligandrum]|uniref:DNA repair metallo-beta-lactamase domain-containing protein n=1 Tax=Pythium oligandrum TaxID=41045 RepID=A0A8K1CDP8_PYTOL|nr:hypothetical protein Poli38472_000414 [Pythium oligandrum]|eukprot:TMW60372.1 hypothetical protein Poli38472_000414 [Pythium oligandrum]